MRQSESFTVILLLIGLIACFGGCDSVPEQPGENGRQGESQTGETPATETPPTETLQASKEEIVILCGSSFRFPTERLAEMFEAETGNRVSMSFGGSEDHLPHVRAKRAGDVYVTHTPYEQYTEEAGSLLREVKVGFLAPVLVVAKGNPKGIERIENLAQEDLKVVLPNPDYSTCGQMVDALLLKKGIKDAVMKNVGSALMKHHSEIGNHLKLGTREAGIMWNGVAHNYRDDLQIIAGKYEYDEEITVWVMGLSYTEKKEAVEQFLDFVAEHGEAVFAEFGYVK